MSCGNDRPTYNYWTDTVRTSFECFKSYIWVAMDSKEWHRIKSCTYKKTGNTWRSEELYKKPIIVGNTAYAVIGAL